MAEGFLTYDPHMEKCCDDVVLDKYGPRTRGCVVCNGLGEVDGKACPSCFDPERYDHPEDAVPFWSEHDGCWIGSVAQVSDVPHRIIPPLDVLEGRRSYDEWLKTILM